MYWSFWPIQSRKYVKRIKFVKEEIKLGLFVYNTTLNKENLKAFRKIMLEVINVLTKVSEYIVNTPETYILK